MSHRKFDGISISAIMVTADLNEKFKENIEDVLTGKDSVLNRYTLELSQVRNKNIELEGKDYLYNKSLWGLFGKYECLNLVLTDRSDYTTRAFMPNSPLAYSEKSFDYYIHTGYLLDSDNFDQREEKLKRIAKLDQEYKFIGITKIKINPFFLIGNGHSIAYLLKDSIDKIINTETTFGFNVESIDYSDFVVYIFGNNLKDVTNLIVKIRNIRFGQLGEVNEIKRYFLNSLIKSCFTTITIDEVLDNHMIYYSNSTLGYSWSKYSSVFEKGVSLDLESTINKEESKFSLGITVKPGHLPNLKENLDSVSFKDMFKDVLIECGIYDIEISVQGVIENYLLLFNYLLKNCSEHILDISTSYKFDHDLGNKLLYSKNSHWDDAVFILNKLRIPQERIVKLRKQCNALNISDILQQKIYLMISTLNRELCNHINFSLFIELSEFVKEIIQSVEEYYNDCIRGLKKSNYSKSLDVEKIETEILQGVKSYELAFQNRFIKNHSTLEISDFRLSYNGGVQQIISVYDTVYKIIANLFTDKDKFENICLVTDGFDTESRAPTIYINYQHLFNPSLYFLVAVHESANFIHLKLERSLLNSYKRDGYSSMNQQRLYNSLLIYDNIDREQVKSYCDEFIDFNFKNSENESLSHYLHYLLMDVITFMTTFNQNKELFYFWNFYYFGQLSKCYTKEKECRVDNKDIQVQSNGLRPNDYVTIYIRMSLLSHFISSVESFDNSDLSNFVSNELEFNDVLMKKYFEKGIDESYIEIAKKVARKRFNTIQKNEKFVRECFSKLISYSQSEILNKCGFSGTQKCTDLKNKIHENDQILESLNIGKPHYLLDDNCNMTIYVFSILYYHLLKQFNSLIKEQNKEISGWEMILTRSKGSGLPMTISREDKVLINTLGNFYVLDSTKRRNMSSINNCSLESLWDLSQIFKKELFLKILNKS